MIWNNHNWNSRRRKRKKQHRIIWRNYLNRKHVKAEPREFAKFSSWEGVEDSAKILKNEHLFYTTLGFFVSFFVLFTLVLYPYRTYIHPSVETVINLQTTFPTFFWVFSIWGVWSYALFFVFAELWSSFILTLLFWQFVNQITELKEAKRVYAFLALLGQGAVTLSGYFGTLASDIRNKVADSTDPWQISLYWIIGMVTISSLFSMYLYHWIYKNVLTDPRFYNKPKLPGVK